MSHRTSLAFGGLALIFTLFPFPLFAHISIYGSVVDLVGLPIDGAEVRLVPDLDPYAAGRLFLEGRTVAPVLTVLSGKAGDFKLEAPEEGMWTVVVDAEGFVPMARRLDPLVAPQYLQPARLRRDVGTPIRVRRPDGSPAAGAWIWASSDRAEVWRESPLGLWKPAPRLGKLDGEGRTNLPRADGETLDLLQIAPGFEGESWRGVEALETTVRPVAVGERVLEFRWPGGEPAKDVLVSLEPSGANAVAPLFVYTIAVSDGAGRALASVPLDRPFGLELVTSDLYRQAVTVEVPSAGSEPIAVDMAVPRMSTARVVDDVTGRGIPGAFVWSRDERWVWRTDERGEYVVRMAPDETWNLRIGAVAPGYRQVFTRLDEGESTLTLEPLATVEGRVLDAARRPLADVRVVSSDADLWSTRTGSDGRFRLNRRWKGEPFRLRLEKKGFAVRRIELDSLRATYDLGDVVLDPGTTWIGRVLDRDRRPVAGAELLLHPVGAVARATEPTGYTDGDGRFRIRHQAAGRFDLEIRKQGFAAGWFPGLEFSASEKVRDLESLTLEPVVPVAGRVVDADGRPVAGAEIRTSTEFDRSFNPVDLSNRREPDLVTDADGRFRSEAFQAGERFHLAVRRDGYAMSFLENIDVPPVEPLRLVLETEAVVSGRIVSSDREPVPGATVHYRPLQDRRFAATASIHADTEGRFRVGNLPPGPHQLAVVASGHPLLVSDFLLLESGRELDEVVLRLPVGAELHGRVVDASGQGVAVASVSYTPRLPVEFSGSARHSLWVVTGHDGRFRLPGLPVGEAELRIDAGGRSRRLTARLELRPGLNEHEFVLGASRRTRFEDAGDMEGQRASTSEAGEERRQSVPEATAPRQSAGVTAGELHGHVVDESGMPIGGAEVMASYHDHHGSVTGPVYTQADGTFVVRGLPPTGPYQLLVKKRGYEQGRREIASLPASPVEIELGGGKEISGRVLGLVSSELKSLRIEASPVDERGMPLYSLWVPPEIRIGPGETYEILGVNAGRWHLHARTARRQIQQTVSVEPGRDVALDLDFDGGLGLKGRVLAEGDGATGLTIYLASRESKAFWESTTDYRGGFRFDGLAPGTYELKVPATGSGFLHQQELELSVDRDLVIEIDPRKLRPSARVPLIARSPASSPRNDVADWLEPEKPQPGQLLIDRRIGIRFRCIPAGSFQREVLYSEERTEVKITRGFWMMETGVTQGQWRELTQSRPSFDDQCGDGCPVDNVSWFEAVELANRLSRKAGLEDCYTFSCRRTMGGGCEIDNCGMRESACEVAFRGTGCAGFRLPTTAEWEYASEAIDTKEEKENAWFVNGLGGNVNEWVGDWHGRRSGPAEQAQVDPTGPPTGEVRTICSRAPEGTVSGGSGGDCYGINPVMFRPGLGLRLVRTLPP